VSDLDADKHRTVHLDLKRRPQAVSTPSPVPPNIEAATAEVAPVAPTDTALFSELFESAYDGIVIASFGGTILRANQRARQLFAANAGQLISHDIVSLFSGADADILKWIAEKLENKRRVFIECYCNRRDGTTFAADVTVSIIHFDGSDQLCFFVRDVTTRKQTENALKRAQEELLGAAHKAGMAEIATGVLHDVGNVLNSINVSCELLTGVARASTFDALSRVNRLLHDHAADLTDFLANDPQGTKALQVYGHIEEAFGEERQTLQQETQHLQRKVGLLREIVTTQQDYARQGLFFQETVLLDVINDALALQQTRLENNGITVEKCCDPALVLHTQKTKLVYVLINLIQNAIDASKSRPKESGDQSLMKIEATEDADKVHIRVIDNGGGIAPENLTKIFTHGFTTKPDGHGFGLHTSANFAKEVGGEITAFSDGPGKGSCFLLTLRVDPSGHEDQSNG